MSNAATPEGAPPTETTPDDVVTSSTSKAPAPVKAAVKAPAAEPAPKAATKTASKKDATKSAAAKPAAKKAASSPKKTAPSTPSDAKSAGKANGKAAAAPEVRSAAQIQADIDAAQARLASRVDELSDRLNPQHLAEEAVGGIKRVFVHEDGTPKGKPIAIVAGSLTALVVLRKIFHR